MIIKLMIQPREEIFIWLSFTGWSSKISHQNSLGSHGNHSCAVKWKLHKNYNQVLSMIKCYCYYLWLTEWCQEYSFQYPNLARIQDEADKFMAIFDQEQEKVINQLILGRQMLQLVYCYYHFDYSPITITIGFSDWETTCQNFYMTNLSFHSSFLFSNHHVIFWRLN